MCPDALLAAPTDSSAPALNGCEIPALQSPVDGALGDVDVALGTWMWHLGTWMGHLGLGSAGRVGLHSTEGFSNPDHLGVEECAAG